MLLSWIKVSLRFQSTGRFLIMISENGRMSEWWFYSDLWFLKLLPLKNVLPKYTMLMGINVAYYVICLWLQAYTQYRQSHLFITLESACGKTCWSQKGFHVCDNNFSIWLIFCVGTLFNTSLKSAMDPISTVPLTGLKHHIGSSWARWAMVLSNTQTVFYSKI